MHRTSLFHTHVTTAVTINADDTITILSSISTAFSVAISKFAATVTAATCSAATVMAISFFDPTTRT